MVDPKRITKYVVEYTAGVTIELNEDLKVIAHSIMYNPDPDECYFLGEDEYVEIHPADGDTSGMDDYSAIVGNALSYRNGLTLEFGLGENNDEPF